MTHHIEIPRIVLQSGSHDEPDYDSVCLLEAVAWFAGERHSDHPACVSPVLGAFGRSFNDGLSAVDRQRLLPYIELLVGTAGDHAADEIRAWMATDWLVRTFTPVWLRKAGLTARADEVAALPELTSAALAKSAMAAIDKARKEAYAAKDAARDAAKDAAKDAARAAGDAARAAARAAYEKAKGSSSAKWDAAYKAARPLFDQALVDTRVELTDSAFALLDRMIAVRTAVAA